MKQENYSFIYEVYDSIDELNNEDATLLERARSLTKNAYAPYSKFCVAAVATLNNGEIVMGTNQENASYPVGICAERALLASSAVLFPTAYIKSLAISYHNCNDNMTSNEPVSPCGMCRQAIQEHESRYQHPVRLILSGMTGKVFIVEKASQLLPFSFTGSNLGAQ